MKLIGKLICAIKGRHIWMRVTRKTAIMRDGMRVGTASCRIMECTRCGLTKPVKARGPRKAKVSNG